jgi:hypothetical protein
MYGVQKRTMHIRHIGLVAFAASLLAADPKPPATIPVSGQDAQTLRAANDEAARAMKSLQDLAEIIRLRSCLAARVGPDECGQWQKDGTIERIPKPAPKPDAKDPQ